MANPDHGPRIDLAGRRFGRLTAKVYVRMEGRKPNAWQCDCDCGKQVIVIVASLMNGNTTSCGCFHREQLRDRVRTHGGRRTPEYRIWSAIIHRCENPRAASFDRYGGRGIRVCERWRESYANFIADMGQRPTKEHSIERRDNALGYSPENCRWATRSDQARNTRRTRLVSAFGVTLCLADWADVSGVNYSTLHERLGSGEPPESALLRSPRVVTPEDLRAQAIKLIAAREGSGVAA
jgi:hypothetical protein